MRNKQGGNKTKKAKGFANVPRKLEMKKDLEEYAVVTKKLGGCNILVRLLTDTAGGEPVTITAHIRGSLRSRVWINVGDVILVSHRSFSAVDKKVDVVHVYKPDEVQKLKLYEEIREDTHTSNAQEEELVEFIDDDVIDRV